MDDTVLVLPKFSADEIAKHARFLILSLPNNEMSRKSPFIIHKALIGIGGEPKSIKKLRSGDLLIETISAVQSKSFLLAKTFIDSPLVVTPHRTLNSCRGVISESDLLCASETEILEGLSDQGVTQKKPAKNTSVKITREQDSPNESPPVSKRSRRRKTSKTLDAMDTDVDPSDTDYITGLASEEDESLLEADFKQVADNPLKGALSPSSPQK
ncbi:uncharacterized protein TNCV_1830361 [Trichonephila clavipes]|nr:uncharacterized protein TNCV_1830361 [Trichonephila clavipes]